MHKPYIMVSHVSFPCASQEGLTLEIRQSNIKLKTCTFGYTATIADEICNQIEEQIEGVEADYYNQNGPFFIMSDEPILIMNSSTNSLDFQFCIKEDL